MAFFGAPVFISMAVHYKCCIYNILWTHSIATPPLLRVPPPPTKGGASAPSGLFYLMVKEIDHMAY